MKTFNIIEGHIRELIKSNEELSQERLIICKNCSIIKLKNLICNNNFIWIGVKDRKGTRNFKKIGNSVKKRTCQGGRGLIA